MFPHKDWHSFPIDMPCRLYIQHGPNIQLDDNKSKDFRNAQMDKNTLVGRQQFLDTLHLYRMDFESNLDLWIIRKIRNLILI